MSQLVPLSKTSLEHAVTATAASLAVALDTAEVPGVAVYQLVANTDIWWAQGIPDTVFTALASTDVCTVTAGHNLTTGDAFTVSNSDGALPTGLSAATVYWAIVLSPTTFKVATTRAHAIAASPTAIDITTNGTGTQTATTLAIVDAAGSAFLPARVTVVVDGVNGAKVSVVEDSADGAASITQCMVVR